MKNNCIKNLKNTALIILPLFLFSLFLLSSCKEDPIQEDPFFTIEGDPTGLTVTKAAKTQAYVVGQTVRGRLSNRKTPAG
jgi:hypothetical protein